MIELISFDLTGLEKLTLSIMSDIPKKLIKLSIIPNSFLNDSNKCSAQNYNRNYKTL